MISSFLISTLVLCGAVRGIPVKDPPGADVVGAGAAGALNGTSNITTNYQPVSSFFVKTPDYQVKSDFDFESINLALHQEWIELDLFHNGLARFSSQEFQDAGLTDEDRFLIEFMADQELGHATVLSNILGPKAALQCTYQYPFTDVREFLEFNVGLTRWGESGVYGFLENLDNRASAQILLQSITTEARQQMIFRQFEGLFPMPVYFETGITQSMAWTLLSRYIVECPDHNVENSPVAWNIFPRLNITNQPDALRLANKGPGITHNLTAFTKPGRQVNFTWDAPGKQQGPYGQHTATGTLASGPAKYAAFINQYNVSYAVLTASGDYSGFVSQPGGQVFGLGNDFIVNGTMFIALTNSNPHLTPANISLINDYIVAGPELYTAG
jgi:hypothetical protein